MPKKILILCSVCILLQVNDLISQRFQFAGIAGAAKSFTENSPKDIIKADYIEIPLVFCLRDWYNDAHKYYKVRAEFGVSYAQLVRIESSKYDVENFNRRDISWFLGSGLRFSPHMGIALRYTSSFLNMYTNPSDKTVRFKSYFLTFRAEYFF
jgi:hypothetical protein